MVDKDKRAARERAVHDGIPYARALREVRDQWQAGARAKIRAR